MKLRVWRYLTQLLVIVSICLMGHKVARSSAPLPARGVWAYAAKACGEYEIYDDLTVVLRILTHGETYLNMDRFPAEDLPSVLSRIYEKRQERVLRVMADDEVSYGRVVGIIDGIKTRVPRLAIVLLPRGKPDFVMSHWCISSDDALPVDR